ncbi:MAG: APC family permease [Actinomycetota bacterium]
MDKVANRTEQLDRRLGPTLLSLYGIGVMVGAGIYVLVGTVAENAGVLSPLAFLAAGAIAAPTALTYAELSVRIPESAGEAAYVRAAFRSSVLSTGTGLAIVVVGDTSAAAVLRGGVGYLTDLVDTSPVGLTVVLAVALTALAAWGVVESLSAAAAFTIVEILGLLLVVRAGLLAPPSADWTAGVPGEVAVGGFGMAMVLAFFAFVGFEDLVNMAEEVKRPSRTLPIAILTSLVVASLLYGVVSIAAVRSVEISALAGSDRPLALVYEQAGGNGSLLAAIAGVAALNGVLAQMVMAARVLFGLGRRERWLAGFHRTHERFGTPAVATVVVGAVVMVGAATVDVAALAELTSTFLLAVFCGMNITLIVIKRRGDAPGGFTVPSWVPWIGLGGSAAALSVALWP